MAPHSTPCATLVLISWFIPSCCSLHGNNALSCPLQKLLPWHTVLSLSFMDPSILQFPLKLRLHLYQWLLPDFIPRYTSHATQDQVSTALHNPVLPSKAVLCGRMVYIISKFCCKLDLQSWDTTTTTPNHPTPTPQKADSAWLPWENAAQNIRSRWCCSLLDHR